MVYTGVLENVEVKVFIFVNFASRAKIYLEIKKGNYYQRVSRNSLFVNWKPRAKAKGIWDNSVYLVVTQCLVRTNVA